ncbi:MAG: hypothetical protein KF760_30695 [Candidatus Eremiobacteraeota bacterium]|nr:hypothetical protein [Candidatus Eremiobacteraeota bacterium]
MPECNEFVAGQRCQEVMDFEARMACLVVSAISKSLMVAWLWVKMSLSTPGWGGALCSSARWVR